MNDPYYDSGAALAALAVLTFVYIIFLVAIYVVSSLFYARIFEKAGVQGKWRAWVPVYRELIFGKLGDISPWALLIAYGALIVLSWIPFLNFLLGLAVLALLVMAAYRVSLKFGANPLLILLWLIPGVGLLIWLGILAYGKATWQPNIAPSQWAGNFLADKTVWTGVPVQPQAAGNASRGGITPPPGAYPPPPPAGYAPPPPAGYTPPPPPPSTQPPSSDEPPRV